MTASAAPARFPYFEHRTVEQVYADEARVARTIEQYRIDSRREFFPRLNGRRK